MSDKNPFATINPNKADGLGEPSTVIGNPRPKTSEALLEVARKHIVPIVKKRISEDEIKNSTRGMLARRIAVILNEWLSATGQELSLVDQRNIITFLIKETTEPLIKKANPELTKPALGKDAASATTGVTNNIITVAKSKVQGLLLNRIDTVVAATLPRKDLEDQLRGLVSSILTEQRMQLNSKEQAEVLSLLLDDMVGLGPLEPLLNDPAVTDILVNGPKQIYVERFGKLELSTIQFRDNQHLQNIATRIVSQVGRRIDESSPMCDARLLDGSRVNIVIPPLALDGASMSIRRFSNRGITLEKMAEQGNISHAMARILGIVGTCRLNVLVSGGTGSGKTTLLNALSQKIGHDERTITVEDSAELRLQQSHVVRLETRPANLEGEGEVTIRDLVKNALRMRPERIIIGECRGSEVIDMLQAMNTGHDGSMSTIHANTPRMALTRMENMLNMSGFNMPEKVTRSMISGAVNVIVQIARMRDGVRRVTHITEITGMEENTIITQDIFVYKFSGEGADGKLVGEFVYTGINPSFATKAKYFGLEKELMEALSVRN
jgi:pilus assembly protein CpaF